MERGLQTMGRLDQISEKLESFSQKQGLEHMTWVQEPKCVCVYMCTHMCVHMLVQIIDLFWPLSKTLKLGSAWVAHQLFMEGRARWAFLLLGLRQTLVTWQGIDAGGPLRRTQLSTAKVSEATKRVTIVRSQHLQIPFIGNLLQHPNHKEQCYWTFILTREFLWLLREICNKAHRAFNEL